MSVSRKMKACALLSLLVLIAPDCSSITLSSAQNVWRDVNAAVGRSFPMPPKMVVKKMNTPAVYSPSRKTVSVDEGLLDLCDSFGADSLNAFAYVIAHELVHHYWEHGVSFMGDLDFGLGISSERHDADRVLRYESEADIRAGFFAQIAGYSALERSGHYLDVIYESYNLDPHLAGYPSLEQRKEITQHKREELYELWQVFELGVICYQLDLNKQAAACFEEVLRSGFTSPAIYNNMAASILRDVRSQVIDEQHPLSFLPPSLEFQTNLSPPGQTRNLGVSILEELNTARSYLSRALALNPNFDLAQYNVFIADVHEAYVLKAPLPSLPSQEIFDSLNVERSDVEIILDAIGRGISVMDTASFANPTTYQGSVYMRANGRHKKLNNKNLLENYVEFWDVHDPESSSSYEPVYTSKGLKIYKCVVEIGEIYVLKARRLDPITIAFEREQVCGQGYHKLMAPNGASVCVAYAVW